MQIFEYIQQKFYSVTHYDHFNWKALGLTVGITFLCLIIEAVTVGWRSSSVYKLSSRFKPLSNDVFSFFFYLTGLTQLVGILFYGGVFYFIYGQVQKHFHFHLIAMIDSVVLQFVIMLLITDFRDYIIHVLRHYFGWVWELHKFHHSAEDMTIFTSFRSHAAESLLTEVLSLVVFIILGAPAETYLIVTLVHQAHQKLTHSQISSDWGWLGRYILVSPAAHRLHHSKDPAHYGKNFGVTFIIWDRLFGTDYKPDPQMQIEFGLPDNEFNQKGYIHDIFASYFRSLRAAKKSAVGYINSARRKKITLPENRGESIETSL